MKTPLIIRPEAEADLADAYQWYEKQREGLGADFLAEVNRSLTLIQTNPQLFAVIRNEARRALVNRFPYGIFYVIHDGKIFAVAVFHASRDPKNWEGRL